MNLDNSSDPGYNFNLFTVRPRASRERSPFSSERVRRC